MSKQVQINLYVMWALGMFLTASLAIALEQPDFVVFGIGSLTMGIPLMGLLFTAYE